MGRWDSCLQHWRCSTHTNIYLLFFTFSIQLMLSVLLFNYSLIPERCNAVKWMIRMISCLYFHVHKATCLCSRPVISRSCKSRVHKHSRRRGQCFTSVTHRKWRLTCWPTLLPSSGHFREPVIVVTLTGHYVTLKYLRFFKLFCSVCLECSWLDFKETRKNISVKKNKRSFCCSLVWSKGKIWKDYDTNMIISKGKLDFYSNYYFFLTIFRIIWLW